MRDTRNYNADFYRAEIERDTLTLTQAISNDERVLVQNRIAAARAHLHGTALQPYSVTRRGNPIPFQFEVE
jgi:hypothetical protein